MTASSHTNRPPAAGPLAVLAGLFLAWAPVCASAQEARRAEEVSADRFQGVLDRLARNVERGTYHGVVAVVEIDGERVLETALGRRDADRDEPIAFDAIFRIYSMTKPVTAVAALILVEAGKLELDAPVSRYLPQLAGLEVGVRRKDPDSGETVLAREPTEREMTVRDLLRHTAGLTYGLFADSAVDRLVLASGVFAEGTTNETLVTKLATVPLKAQPGTRFEYSLATDVLGRVVEVVSEQSLARFMRERIFAPLGMVDTGFHVHATKLGRVAAIYRRSGADLASAASEVDDPGLPPSKLSGGGGLFSTADDYLRFCNMLLGGGALGEVRILEPATVAEMTRDQLGGVPAPMLMFTGGAYGLGLGVIATKRDTGPHEGSYWWGGYAGTGFWVDPTARTVGVFLIQNMTEMLHSTRFQRDVYSALGR